VGNLFIVFRSLSNNGDICFSSIGSAIRAVKSKRLPNSSLCLVCDKDQKNIITSGIFSSSSSNTNLLEKIYNLRSSGRDIKSPYLLDYKDLGYYRYATDVDEFLKCLNELVKYNLGKVEISVDNPNLYVNCNPLGKNIEFKSFICDFNLSRFGDYVNFTKVTDSVHQKLLKCISDAVKECATQVYHTPSSLSGIVAVIGDKVLINYEDFPPMLVDRVNGKCRKLLYNNFKLQLYNGNDFYYTTWFDVTRCVKVYRVSKNVQWYLDFDYRKIKVKEAINA
jgi:hypothetical protein